MERRTLLTLLGGSASLGLAGCLGGGGDSDDDNESTGNGNNNDSTGNGNNNDSTGNGNGSPEAEANFAVTFGEFPSGVQAGESVTIPWTVENTGDAEGTGTVTFSVSGTQEGSEEVTLGGGESATGEFTYTATAGASDELMATVTTDDSEDSAALSILEEAYVAVTISTVPPVRVEAGADATVAWEAENTGDLEATQELLFSVDGTQEDSQEITLGGGETVEGEFSYSTDAEAVGTELMAAVSSDDEEADIPLVLTEDEPVVSGFSAAAESARIGLDSDQESYTDPETDALQEVETEDPLVELTGEIFNEGSWESTEISVPDLVDILLGIDTEQRLVDAIEEFDIQEDLIDAFDFDESTTEVISFIESLEADEEQAAAAGAILNVIQEAFEIELPAGLKLGDTVEDVLLEPEEQITGLLSLLGIETMEDLVMWVINNLIDEVGTIEELEQYLVDQVQEGSSDELLSTLSLEVEPPGTSGTVDPASTESELLMTVPLTTVTLVPSIEASDVEPPEVDLDLGIELTTGESGSLAGSVDLDTDADTAQMTVVDNEFTLDITEFDLVGVLEGLDPVELMATIFEFLEIDPAEYDLDLEARVQELDIVSLVESGEPLVYVDDFIQDEPGRHAVEADLGLEFDDLQAVLDIESAS